MVKPTVILRDWEFDNSSGKLNTTRVLNVNHTDKNQSIVIHVPLMVAFKLSW